MRLVAFLAAFGLLAAACGTDSDGDGGDAELSGEVEGAEEEGLEPEYGGTLRFAVEADTGSPWRPHTVACAISCHQTLKSVFEPLTLVNEDGQWEPYLASSFTPNEDFTEWRITARDGITFHDGTPFDGAAIADNLTWHAGGTLTTGEEVGEGILTGRVMSDVDTITVDPDDPQTAIVTTVRPWTELPNLLSGQIGYMASPTWLAAVEAGTAEATEPVGTGAFVYESYTPGDGFTATRNEAYWRGDGPESITGEGLPYLDRYEVLFINDVQSRSNALLSGEADAMHTGNGDEISRLRDEDGIRLLEDSSFAETNYILLHPTQEGSILTDQRVREAMAASLDRNVVSEARTAGIFPVANGPFPPGTCGSLEDTGFPEYDPDHARELIDEVSAEIGGPVSFAYKTTTDPFNLTTAELYQQFWEEVGMEVSIDQIEQSEFILQALQGNFEAFGWRNHGFPDPDQNLVWWTSETADPIGDLGVNFGRIRDEDIDAQLDIIRTSSDEEERCAAAEEINRIFGEEVYNIWTTWNIWGLPTAEDVHGQTTFTNPDTGNKVRIGNGFAGAYDVTSMWIEQ